MITAVTLRSIIANGSTILRHISTGHAIKGARVLSVQDQMGITPQAEVRALLNLFCPSPA